MKVNDIETEKFPLMDIDTFKSDYAQSDFNFELSVPVLQDVQWLKNIIRQRADELINEEDTKDIPIAPELRDGTYKYVVENQELDTFGRLLLITAFAAFYDPHTFTPLLIKNPITHQLHPKIGGQYSKLKNQFLPGFRTVIFLLCGEDELLQTQYISYLHRGHQLLKEQIIYAKAPMANDDFIGNSLLEIDEEYFGYFLDGKKPRLDHGSQFPARLIKTDKTFDDLIVKDRIKGQFKPIVHYMTAKQANFFEENEKFQAGYAVLLYGPPGTGKTFASAIIGNVLQLDVYKVDLSGVISKYIGETEKNLKAIFDRLQGKNCILYFDEADALFGKRSEVNDAKDRYANQEISYLLQRIEEFDGLTILSTNYENNIDEAFMRRISIKINMTRPEEKERVQLWSYYTPNGLTYENQALQLYLAMEYSFTGANIKSILKMAAMELHNTNNTVISHDIILPYLKMECEKAFGPNYTISSYAEFLRK